MSERRERGHLYKGRRCGTPRPKGVLVSNRSIVLALVLLGSLVGVAGGAAASAGNRAAAVSVRYQGPLPTTASVRSRAGAWCGDGETPTNRPNSELSSANLIHVVYAVPSDGTDRFATYAPAIAADLGALDAWWRAQDPTRTPRFDLAAFPCDTTLGRIDLSFVRLPEPASAFMGGSTDRLEHIIAGLGALMAPAVKTIAYYDGPVPSADRFKCGTTTGISPTMGGTVALSVEWMQSDCPRDFGQGRFQAVTTAHELLHNLGAQPKTHPCPSDEYHPCDSETDVLYPVAYDDSTLFGDVLDFGHDDYYTHSGSWFDVQDSAWLAHIPSEALAVAANGSGTVALTAPGGSLSCAPSCSATLENGVAVKLDAKPARGMRLVRWDGDCSGSATSCSVTMSAARNVTAVFGQGGYPIRVAVAGNGRVTSSPAGLSCPSRCQASFFGPVTLRAKAAAGFRFTGWLGACGGRGACRLDRKHAGLVQAVFSRRR